MEKFKQLLKKMKSQYVIATLVLLAIVNAIFYLCYVKPKNLKMDCYKKSFGISTQYTSNAQQVSKEKTYDNCLLKNGLK